MSKPASQTRVAWGSGLGYSLFLWAGIHSPFKSCRITKDSFQLWNPRSWLFINTELGRAWGIRQGLCMGGGWGDMETYKAPLPIKNPAPPLASACAVVAHHWRLLPWLGSPLQCQAPEGSISSQLEILRCLTWSHFPPKMTPLWLWSGPTEIVKGRGEVLHEERLKEMRVGLSFW